MCIQFKQAIFKGPRKKCVFFKASSAYTLTPAWKIPKLFVSISRRMPEKFSVSLTCLYYLSLAFYMCCSSVQVKCDKEKKRTARSENLFSNPWANLNISSKLGRITSFHLTWRFSRRKNMPLGSKMASDWWLVISEHIYSLWKCKKGPQSLSGCCQSLKRFPLFSLVYSYLYLTNWNTNQLIFSMQTTPI